MDLTSFIADLPKLVQNFDLGKFLLSILWILAIIYVILSFFLAFKTFHDASKRLNDRLLVYVFAAFVFIFNIPGYIVYSVIRPREFIQDQHMLKLEKYFLEYETRGIGKCKVCKHLYFPEHTYCINCGNVVRAKCNSCNNSIELDWHVCPFCGDKKKMDLEATLKDDAPKEDKKADKKEEKTTQPDTTTASV